MKRTMMNKLYSAWDAAWITVDAKISTCMSRLLLRLQGCSYGSGFYSFGKCRFKARQSGSIRIGKSVALVSNWRANRVGLTNPVLLETFGDGVIEIGDFTGASSVVISSRSKVSVGMHCKIGANVRIFDHDFHSLDPMIRKTRADNRHVVSTPVTIGDDVFIGTNAMILKGVTVGDRSVIAAGAVVTKEVPSDEVWGGNPAYMISSGKNK